MYSALIVIGEIILVYIIVWAMIVGIHRLMRWWCDFCIDLY